MNHNRRASCEGNTHMSFSQRNRSIRQMTTTSSRGRINGSIPDMSYSEFLQIVNSDAPNNNNSSPRRIASGQVDDRGTTIIQRHLGVEQPTTNSDRRVTFDTHSSDEDADEKTPPDFDRSLSHLYEGYEDDAISFPQSTHSWLFTESVMSLPFWFAIGIAGLSYTCMILALFNIFEDSTAGNLFAVPFQVSTSVRIAQYLAIVIALIMEEEIPTGLYLLRLITKDSLHKIFPKMKFGRFVAAAFVRLVMGYLFLFNTFCVVVQATAVLDIFFDVLALQFLQQLDDISFNLSKIDVMGKRLKRAALSKRFRAEFEKSPFKKRKNTTRALKGLYFVNLCALLFGLGYVTYEQNQGAYYSNSITVTFGEQIWSGSIVLLPSGEQVERTLLFSYFNGVYTRNTTLGLHDGRPVYTEQSKFDGDPYTTTIGAEIKYCKSENAWVLVHPNIKKSEQEISDCPWLLRSSETSEFELLSVTGDWAVWTGLLQEGSFFSATDNTCRGPVDCNFHGQCIDGECVCEKENGFYGLHCEHTRACTAIRGREGGWWASIEWAADEMLIYQRAVYQYQGEDRVGVNDTFTEKFGFNILTDQFNMAYSGSRWLGAVFKNVRLAALPRDWWKNYVREYHAFWNDLYNQQTRLVSDPALGRSSIIGVDFYSLGEQGEEFGDYGELFPLSDPKGSGFFSCIEEEKQPVAYDMGYLRHFTEASGDSIGVVIQYEIKTGRQYETVQMAFGCVDPITGIDLQPTPKRTIAFWDSGYDLLELSYSVDKSQLTNNATNIWNAETEDVVWCQITRLIEDSEIILQEPNIISALAGKQV